MRARCRVIGGMPLSHGKGMESIAQMEEMALARSSESSSTATSGRRGPGIRYQCIALLVESLKSLF